MGDVVKDDKYYREKYPLYFEMYNLQQKGEPQRIREFLEWLDENGFRIAQYHGKNDELMPTVQAQDEFICGFFEIDYKEWRKQSEAFYSEILDEQRNSNARAKEKRDAVL